jgi:hypothetical protein
MLLHWNEILNNVQTDRRFAFSRHWSEVNRLIPRGICGKESGIRRGVFTEKLGFLLSVIIPLIIHIHPPSETVTAVQRHSPPYGSTAPWGPRPHHFSRLHDHTHFRHTTLGRTPLDEWPARRRDLYLTTHDTHNRQTSMPPVGFEPTILVSERPQTHALDRAVHSHTPSKIFKQSVI